MLFCKREYYSSESETISKLVMYTFCLDNLERYCLQATNKSREIRNIVSNLLKVSQAWRKFTFIHKKGIYPP